MTFDPIMQVGRTPKITEDIITNPFKYAIEDIAPSAVATYTGGTSSLTGNINNTIDPDYPSNTASMTFAIGFIGGGANNTFTYDLTKVLFIKNCKFQYKFSDFSGTNTAEVRLQASNNGTTYTTLSTLTYTANTAIETIEYNYFKARFIRIVIGYVAPSSSIDAEVYKLKIVPEDLQQI